MLSPEIIEKLGPVGALVVCVVAIIAAQWARSRPDADPPAAGRNDRLISVVRESTAEISAEISALRDEVRRGAERVADVLGRR